MPRFVSGDSRTSSTQFIHPGELPSVLGEPNYPDPEDDLVGAWAHRIGSSRRAIRFRSVLCAIPLLVSAVLGYILFGSDADRSHASPLLHTLFITAVISFVVAGIWLLLEVAAPHHAHGDHGPQRPGESKTH